MVKLLRGFDKDQKFAHNGFAWPAWDYEEGGEVDAGVLVGLDLEAAPVPVDGLLQHLHVRVLALHELVLADPPAQADDVRHLEEWDCGDRINNFKFGKIWIPTDPDPNWIRIRIQEGKNDPQK